MTMTPDYSTWLTKQQAAEAIGVTTKSVERFVQAGQIQQARWQREGRGPLLAVYHPDDVARIAQARRGGPLPPFVVPGTNGNGHSQALAQVESKLDPSGMQLTVPPGDDVLRLLFAAALRAVSETSQTVTVFVTIPEASALSGLSQTYLRRKIAAGELKAEKDRGWKIRRKDLESL